MKLAAACLLAVLSGCGAPPPHVDYILATDLPAGWTLAPLTTAPTDPQAPYGLGGEIGRATGPSPGEVDLMHLAYSTPEWASRFARADLCNNYVFLHVLIAGSQTMSIGVNYGAPPATMAAANATAQHAAARLGMVDLCLTSPATSGTAP